MSLDTPDITAECVYAVQSTCNDRLARFDKDTATAMAWRTEDKNITAVISCGPVRHMWHIELTSAHSGTAAPVPPQYATSFMPGVPFRFSTIDELVHNLVENARVASTPGACVAARFK